MKKAYKNQKISIMLHKEINDFLDNFAEDNFKTKTEVIMDFIMEKYKQEKSRKQIMTKYESVVPRIFNQYNAGYYDLNGGHSSRIFQISSKPCVYDQIAGVVNTSTITGSLSGFNFLIDNPEAVDLTYTRVIRPVMAGEINYDFGEGAIFKNMQSIKSLSADTLGGYVDPGLTQILSKDRIRIWSSTHLASTTGTVILAGCAKYDLGSLSYGGVQFDTLQKTERELVKDYVWKRLGYPVVTVELADEQFDVIYEEVKATYPAKKIKAMTYAYCMETLGMIRNKYDSIAIPNGSVKLGPSNLTELGIEKQKIV